MAMNNLASDLQAIDPRYKKWVDLVARIRRNDDTGMEDLYSILSKGVRYYFVRELGPEDVEDRIHECFLQIVEAIRNDVLREPERLMGFVRVVAQRQAFKQIDVRIRNRRHCELDSSMPLEDLRENPARAAGVQERQALAKRVLSELSQRDREILRRFYLDEESEKHICSEMQLTSTQFRLLKSRAKIRFGELGKKKVRIRMRVRQVVKKAAIA